MYWVTCVERGEVDKMLRFIRMGIDVNERLPNGDTPLHVCVRCGHVSAAQVLLLSGARKETKNNLGYSPILLYWNPSQASSSLPSYLYPQTAVEAFWLS